MWPWGHLAVGYLLYSGYLWVRFRERPRGWPVVALAVGALFPDVVDKPLAYWFGVIPEGRSLAHSVFALVLVCAAVLWVARRSHRGAWGAAFALGYASHLPADGYGAVLSGRFGELTFLLWPVLPAPDYEAEDFAYHLQQLLAALSDLDANGLVTGASDPFLVQLLLFVAVALLWAFHGAPPLPSVRIWWAGR